MHYPTMYLFLNHDPTPIFFEGARQPNAILSWIDSKMMATFDEIE